MKMRTALRSILLAAMVVALSAACTAPPKSGPWMRIDPKASEIWLYDGSPNGTGPLVPATSVTAHLYNCPEGDYMVIAELVQDGVEAQWATTAHGAGEVFCHDGEDQTVSMGFYRYPGEIHPGEATATFGLRTSQGDVLVTETQVVDIPRST